MPQSFTITSPSVKIILLICVGIYIIMYCFEIMDNSGLNRLIDVANQKPGGIVIINDVKYPAVYQVNQVRINYTVQNPLEYLLLNSGSTRESLTALILKLAIALLSGLLLWKFDFTNPFKPIFFIRTYTIFRLLVATFLLNYAAYRYSTYFMGSFLRGNNFHYVNAPNGGYWFQISIAVVIMYMYGNAVKNKQEIDLTI